MLQLKIQLKSLAARAIRAPLARYGFELHRRGVAPNWQLTAELLRRYNVEPRTVFDIGVAAGTPWLYESFSQLPVPPDRSDA